MTVYLVGAGPGDPGLITLRGAEVLGRADAVFYDRLSVASLLELAPATALKISVGKASDSTTGSISQREINQMLVEYGSRLKVVVRLKGGDPFVFARGGEELSALLEARVDFEVIPGVSSALSAPGFAGVPLTFRGLSDSLSVITGRSSEATLPERDYRALAQSGGTIVVLMGVATRTELAERLMAGGLDPETPVCAIRWAFARAAQVTRCCLAELGQADIHSPATIVIGKVAGLNLLGKGPPLRGLSIALTRPTSNQVLGELMSREGAKTLEVPLVEVSRSDAHREQVKELLDTRRRGDWLALTSTNSVAAVFDILRDARELHGVKVAAVGEATAKALRSRGVEADLVGAGDALALASELAKVEQAVLYPRSGASEGELESVLESSGVVVRSAVAYTTSMRTLSASEVTTLTECDLITLCSGSAARSLYEQLPRDRIPPVAGLGQSVVRATNDNGGYLDVLANQPTIESLAEAIVEWAAEKKRQNR